MTWQPATTAPYWQPATEGLTKDEVLEVNQERARLERRMHRQAVAGYRRFLAMGGAAERVVYEDVSPERPILAWKGFEAFTHEANRRPIWPPILGNLCRRDTRFRTSTAVARCTARPRPCASPPGAGCPAECGIFSAVALDDLRWGIDLAVAALVENSGRVFGVLTDTGEAWRAERSRIRHLLVAPMYARSKRRNAAAGFEKRYGVPVTVVAGPPLLPYVPIGNFVEAAAALGLPTTSRVELYTA